VPPDVHSDWSDPFDYAALGAKADFVVLMNYEEHWTGDPVMGSVASLGWFAAQLQNILGEVPSTKVISGMPLYTRDWRIEAGGVYSNDLELKEQATLLSQLPVYRWDTDSGQYVAAYAQYGINHYIWMEDSRSLTLKAMEGLRRGVAGSAFWYVGAETPDVWPALRNAERMYELIWKQ